MMTFLITFLIIVLLFRLVVPHLLRWALKAFLKKTIRNGTFRPGSPMDAGAPFAGPEARPEGQVRVDYVPQDPAARPKEFRGGEYVEYEEVK